MKAYEIKYKISLKGLIILKEGETLKDRLTKYNWQFDGNFEDIDFIQIEPTEEMKITAKDIITFDAKLTSRDVKTIQNLVSQQYDKEGPK